MPPRARRRAIQPGLRVAIAVGDDIDDLRRDVFAGRE
jgi:hypothetical protein